MIKKEKRLFDQRAVWMLFSLCWMVYFSSYLARRNFSAAMTDMIAAGFLQMDTAGLINTAFFISYAVGQLCNGILGDRIRPSRLLVSGALVSGLCNLAMGAVSRPIWMLPLWALNGYALSMLWPPILRIFSERLLDENKVKCTVNISTSVAAGTLLSYLLCAGEIAWWGWRSTFWLAGGWMLIMALLWAVGYPRVEARCEVIETETPPAASGTAGRPPLLKLLLTGTVLWLVVPTIVQGVLRDGVTSWVPTYVSENFWADPSFAVLASTLLPVLNLVGPYAARFLQKKRFHSEAATSAAFFLLATASLACLITFGKSSLFGSVFFFALITSSMEAINVMLIGILPLRYGRFGCTATVSGFFNFLTYAGTALSTYGVGLLAERSGWDSALLAWIALSSAAFLLCLGAVRFLRRRDPAAEKTE